KLSEQDLNRILSELESLSDKQAQRLVPDPRVANRKIISMGSDNLIARLANLSPAKRALLEPRLKEKSPESVATASIPRRCARHTAPLSFAQQRLWFLNQLEPESPAYNESSAVRLSGILDIDAFKRALEQIVLRHEVLRTVIVNVEGSPCQVVSSNR